MALPSTATDTGATTQLDRLLRFDRDHVWHPYAAPGAKVAAVVESASGARLRCADGRELVDAMSSWWCAIHGYRHPVLDAAARDQLDRMAHVMFGGLTHQPGVDVAEALLDLAPDPMARVFLCDSGSVSVEVALKMAVQAQRGLGHPRRTRFLALAGGYHGDTVGAMSVSDPLSGMHSMYDQMLPRHLFAPRPPAGLTADIEAWAVEVRRLVAAHAHELAAIICEPVLQGAGGMHIYNPACLVVLREAADEHGIVLVFDEIATGFGRTGTLFAAEHAAVSPDIMCVGKALTGGYVTLAATLCTAKVAEAIGGSEAGVLMHGPTFMANPLACAIARANLGLIAAGEWAADVARINRRLEEGLEPARVLPAVRDVRVIGAVGVIQTEQPVDVRAITEVALAHGVWVRPFRDLVYTMPPYVAADDDLAAICAALLAAVRS